MPSLPWWAASWPFRDGADVGSLASYLVFVRQTAMPINQFTQQSNLILAAMSGAERIFALMEEQPEVDEGKVTLTNVAVHEDGTLYECSLQQRLMGLAPSASKQRGRAGRTEGRCTL